MTNPQALRYTTGTNAPLAITAPEDLMKRHNAPSALLTSIKGKHLLKTAFYVSETTTTICKGRPGVRNAVPLHSLNRALPLVNALEPIVGLLDLSEDACVMEVSGLKTV